MKASGADDYFLFLKYIQAEFTYIKMLMIRTTG